MIEELIKALPKNPGVYLMFNEDNEVIYVGKAKNLKNRVTQYFRKNSSHTAKVKKMVSNVYRFEYIITKSEFEAFVLECNLIKSYYPKYNILLKDDKAYPYLKVTVNEDYPRAVLARKIINDGAEYFGPYISSNVVRQTIDTIHNIFNLRNCNKNISQQNIKRPCLNYDIKRCTAPCCNKISKDEYNILVNDALNFLKGKDYSIIDRYREEMLDASKKLEFERAARIRDRINSLETIKNKQIAISLNQDNADIFAIYSEEDIACVQIFFMRDGKIIRREHYFMDIDIGADNNELLNEFVKQYYSMQTIIPSEIIIQREIEDTEFIEKWLSEIAKHKVNVRIPQKGKWHNYVKMAEKNAIEQIKLKLLEKDQTTQKATDLMFEIKEQFGLEKIPMIIESYDNSHISGSDAVGVCVSFENGMPKKSKYKKFNIRSENTADDYNSMKEVLYRRLSNGIEGENGFIPLPDLILLDGGAGQLNAAMEIMDFLHLNIPVFGVVKDDKHTMRGVISVNGEVGISRVSSVFKFLTNVSNEVHRFAINTHRNKRTKNMVKSELNEIKGVGEVKKKILIKHFTSIKNIKEASVAELESVKGIDKKTAEEIYAHFH